MEISSRVSKLEMRRGARRWRRGVTFSSKIERDSKKLDCFIFTKGQKVVASGNGLGQWILLIWVVDAQFFGGLKALVRQQIVILIACKQVIWEPFVFLFLQAMFLFRVVVCCFSFPFACLLMLFVCSICTLVHLFQTFLIYLLIYLSEKVH